MKNMLKFMLQLKPHPERLQSHVSPRKTLCSLHLPVVYFMESSKWFVMTKVMSYHIKKTKNKQKKR